MDTDSGYLADKPFEEPFDIFIDSVEIEVEPLEIIPHWAHLYLNRVTDDNKLMLAVCKSAILQAHEHAAASDNEVGGSLLGRAYRFDGYLAVEIAVILPGIVEDAGPLHVTLGANTWAELIQKHQKNFPDLMFVGWYHSHPGFGIYLSHMDENVHRSFFFRNWHIAYVMNGQHDTGGFFGWYNGEIKPIREFVLLGDLDGDSITVQNSYASYCLINNDRFKD